MVKIIPTHWLRSKRWSLLLVILLTACNSKSSGSDLKNELQKVTSWAATAQMIGDAWLENNIPTTYAKTALSKTQEELYKETDTLKHSSKDHSLLEQVQTLESTVSKISSAIKYKDHNAMLINLKQLSSQKQKLSALASGTGKEKS